METKTKTIGDYEYRVTQLTTGPGLQLTARVMNILGPGLANAAGASGGTGARAAALFGAIVASPQLGDHLEWLSKLLAPTTQVWTPDGKSFTLSSGYDAHFAGRYAQLLEWLLFAIEVNCGSFFAELLGGKLIPLATPSNSRSPNPAAVTG